jgi:hypothetical protein
VEVTTATPATEIRIECLWKEREMAGLVTLQAPRGVWKQPVAQLLDEARWDAWVAKGRAQERRGSAVRLQAAKIVAVAALMVMAAVWSNPTPLDIVARFIVAAAAIVMMFHELDARQYAFAAAFCLIVLLYNPIAPVFTFSSGWQRGILVASAGPFIVAMQRHEATLEPKVIRI